MIFIFINIYIFKHLHERTYKLRIHKNHFKFKLFLLLVNIILEYKKCLKYYLKDYNIVLCKLLLNNNHYYNVTT